MSLCDTQAAQHPFGDNVTKKKTNVEASAASPEPKGVALGTQADQSPLAQPNFDDSEESDQGGGHQGGGHQGGGHQGGGHQGGGHQGGVDRRESERELHTDDSEA